MKKLLLLAVLAAVLAGCKSKEFKSTPFYEGTDVKYVGDPRERVNLWPVAYWHNPVGSVAWPVVSFSDDLFALRPLYSQYKQDGASGAYDEFNLLWPIAQADTKHNDYRLFPVFWGESRTKGEYYQAIFPLYFNGPNYNALLPLWCYHAKSDLWTFSTLAGLAGARKDESECYRASWCFPLWYENSEGVLATTLFGYGKDSAWIFPISYWDKDSFISIPYSRGRYGDSDNTWWSVPLTLSWGSSRHRDKSDAEEGRLLLGLFGWDWHDWKDARNNDSYQRHEWWCGPLMGYEGRSSSSETWFLLHLAAHSTSDGKADSSHLIPLYWWEKDRCLMTPLGGWDRQSYYITPLVGINRAESKWAGGYVFPIWFYEKNRDFEEKVAMMDGEKLPESIVVCEESRTNDVGKIETRLTARTSGLSVHDRTTWFLLGDCDRNLWVYGYNGFDAQTYTCRLDLSHKFGNRLLLSSEGERKVAFDLATREKLSDEEKDELSFLIFLYSSESSFDRMKGETYARHRVLWKLWDYEEVNGKVTLDVFPGFTYDKDKDGNSKTSFLWRFYNYERTSAGGTNLDLLFIPILRAE